MAAKDGSKTGGRKKGTPNKRTQDLLDKAREIGRDPFETLLLFSNGDWEALGYSEEKYLASSNEHGDFYKYTIDPSVRASCAERACQYIHPKRKAIEITGKDGEDLQQVVIMMPSNGREQN